MEENFLYNIEKINLPDKIQINLFYVDKNKNTQIIQKEQDYEIKISKIDFENLKQIMNLIEDNDFTIKNQDLKFFQIEEIMQIKIHTQELFNEIRKVTKKEKIRLFELDLIPEHKYIIDNDITIYDKNNLNFPKFKYLIFDIETITILDKNIINNIVSISTFSTVNSQNKVYVSLEHIENKKETIDKIKKNSKYQILYFDTEKEMLTSFRDEIIKFSPQIILGWNIVDFDFKVIFERFKNLKIDIKFSNYEGDVKLKIQTDFFRQSSLIIPGVLVFDIIYLLKINFIQFKNYKLDTVAKQVLSIGKLDLELETSPEPVKLGIIENKQEQINKLYFNDLNKLIKYNFIDSELCDKILEKLQIFELIITRSIITSTPLKKIASPIASFDIMYIKELRKHNMVAKSNFNFTRGEPIEGAFVMSPILGYYRNVYVLDFKSLYPNIIRTFNLDPITISSVGEIISPNRVKFSNEKKGILPQIISKLALQRDKAKEQNDKIKQNAIKVTMNSFYGAIASSKSRFHSPEIGEAITGFGREIIKKTRDFVEKLGSKVIYGDTDSIFIQFKNNEETNLNKLKSFGIELEEEINEFVLNYAKKQNSKNPYLKIEFEKLYSKFFIASKKRYVGFDLLANKLAFVGMEYVRGDWTKLAKKFQYKLVKLIFENLDTQKLLPQKIKEMILNFRDDLEKGKYDNDLIYYKKLTKDLVLYTKTTPPHVKAAREVKGFNQRLVMYVVTKQGPKHISLIDKTTEIDYEHYIEKQLDGVSDDLLKPLNINFEDIIYKSHQTSLTKFFK